MMSDLQKEKDIIQGAVMAAAIAVKQILDENPHEWYPCGLASVVIKPATGKFVAALKELNIGFKKDEGGYCVVNPAQTSSQWMPAIEVGAEIFATVLREYGVKCKVTTRMD